MARALFLVYNKPLQIFVQHLFDGNSSIRIDDLSEEQLPIYNLPLNRNYIVKGGPGTGKTVMAYFRANRIAEGAVDVKTYHSWLWDIIIELGEDPLNYQIRDFVYNWNQVTQLFEEKGSPKLFDNYQLFIDEAQDFPKELAAILSKYFKKVTIFIDEHQSIERTTKVHEIRHIFNIESNPLYLSKNYRNTPEIYQVARLFFTGDYHLKLLPEECYIKSLEEKPRVLYDHSFQDTIDFLANYAHSFPQKMIGVVLPKPEILDKYYSALRASRLEFNLQKYKQSGRDRSYNKFNFRDSGLKLLTINTVKGLEFDTVFICEVDNDEYKNITNEKKGKLLFNRLYVTCSRAKTELFFTCKNYEEKTFILDTLNNNSKLLEYANDKVRKVSDELDLDDVPF